ncbi:hypothetical protein EWM64_g5154 [Hericium alpestre]|uniref:Uncharacterized protein n=1 Tax=Hericium alpestre TaxID=135208 RepID=A0A4Y9ZVD3_9AGAM|nr:hypothetical protein EWM64_g5154 [Hericium alpestre]
MSFAPTFAEKPAGQANSLAGGLGVEAMFHQIMDAVQKSVRALCSFRDVALISRSTAYRDRGTAHGVFRAQAR